MSMFSRPLGATRSIDAAAAPDSKAKNSEHHLSNEGDKLVAIVTCCIRMSNVMTSLIGKVGASALT